METLLPEARILNEVPLRENELTVRWTAPPNQNFLTNYIVSYSTTSVRNRRQVTTVPVPAGTTSTTLPFVAFTDYTVDVDAIYNPPGGDVVTVNLLPSTTFRTPERSRLTMKVSDHTLFLSFSLSLSLTHTHTHTFGYSI